MGEIADMILDGILDEETGEYLGEATGYPRSFQRDQREYHEWVNKNQFDNALNGVMKWIKSRGIKNDEDAHALMKEYAFVINYQITSKRPMIRLAIEIQKDFPAFINWADKNIDGFKRLNA